MGKGGTIGYITNSLGYFKMGSKNRYKPENGQGFCLSCQTNNVQIKKLIALHGCKGEEEPEASGCMATFLTRNEAYNNQIGVLNNFALTFKINDGVTQTVTGSQVYDVMDVVLKHPTEVHKSLFMWFPVNIETLVDNVSILSGFNSNGTVAGDVTNLSIVNETRLYYEHSYDGPFSFEAVENTMTLYPTVGHGGPDMYYLFGGTEEGTPLVIKSCAVLNLGKPSGTGGIS